MSVQDPHIVTKNSPKIREKKAPRGKWWRRLLIVFGLWILQGIIFYSSGRPSQMDNFTYQNYLSGIQGFWMMMFFISYCVGSIRRKDKWYLIIVWTVLATIGECLVMVLCGVFTALLGPHADSIGIITSAWVLTYLNLRQAKI